MRVFLIILLVLQISLTFSQESNDLPLKLNGITITSGYTQFKDENIHPKAFRGYALGFSYQHSRIAKNISEYTAGLKISLMSTAYEDFPSAVNFIIQGNYKYLFVIAGNDDLNYYVGPVVDWQYGTSAYFNWDESHLYFANYLSGGIANRVSFLMQGKSFSFDLDIPIISCIFRPVSNRQYKIDNMKFGGILKNLASNPESAFPNHHFYLKTGLEMNFLTKRKKNRSVGYNLVYHNMQASYANKYQSLDHSILYNIFF